MVYSKKAGVGLILGLLVGVAHADYPADCTVTPTPAGCVPPPEWTPTLYFTIPSLPPEGGSMPKPWIIAQSSAGELYTVVPLSWDLYWINTNAKGPYYPNTLIHSQMSYGDSFLIHLQTGMCFVMIRHQGPVPPSRDVILSAANDGDSSVGGGATSINGTQMACPTPNNINDSSLPIGDVTIEVR